jgi:DNA-binding NarL/FixJ family response regulator
MKILIADDHAMVRDGLGRAIAALDGSTTITEVGSLQEVLHAVETQAFDIAFMDLNMPGMSGLDGIRRLRSLYPTLALVVVSATEDADVIRQVLALGAMGFIPKSANRELIQQAVRLVMAGGVYVPVQALAGSVPVDTKATERIEITERQREVLRLLGRGLPNKAIANELGVTAGTVKLHLAALLRVLRARNRTEAAIRARELGLLE